MSIEFIDPTQSTGLYKDPMQRDHEPQGMIGFLIRRGIVENEKQARITLLIISLIFFSISGYILFNLFAKSTQSVQNTSNSLEAMKRLQESVPRNP